MGGVERHVLEVSRLLVRKGHSVTVLTEKFERGLLDTDEINGIKIIRIDNGTDDWFKKFRVWVNIFNNRKLIIDADIIHAHDIFFWFLPFKLLFSTKKVFVTFHGYEGNNIPNLKSKLMHKISEKFSSGNICVGDFLKKWYGTKPNYVIYGGVNLQNIKYKKYNIKNKKEVNFVFVGRLEEETGIMVYLNALEMLKKEGFRFKIDILGDGSLLRKAQNFIEKNKINANFNGFVRKIDNYIVNSDFVFTSRYLGILEALSFNKFVFAVYNNPIKKDYLSMALFAKFISISKDYKELGGEIELHLKNKKIKENKIYKGYDWVKDKTWENITSTYLKLWGK